MEEEERRGGKKRATKKKETTVRTQNPRHNHHLFLYNTLVEFLSRDSIETKGEGRLFAWQTFKILDSEKVGKIDRQKPIRQIIIIAVFFFVSNDHKRKPGQNNKKHYQQQQ